MGVNRAGVVTITLPSAEVRPGRVYTVKDESGAAAANNITVATEGSETIDGAATNVIGTDYGARSFYSDGSNWFVIPITPAAAAHQANHNSGGSDALKLDDLTAPDDNTDLNYSTSAHGLVPKGPNTGQFLKDDGTWGTPAGGGASQATQAAIEAQTNEDTYAPPDLIKHSPGVAKGWISIPTDGASITGSYNVSSLTDSGTGDRTIVWDVDFSANTYAVVAGIDADGTAGVDIGTPAVGSVQVIAYVGGTQTDRGHYHAAFGDQ